MIIGSASLLDIRPLATLEFRVQTSTRGVYSYLAMASSSTAASDSLPDGATPNQPERHSFPRRSFGKTKAVQRAFQASCFFLSGNGYTMTHPKVWPSATRV